MRNIVKRAGASAVISVHWNGLLSRLPEMKLVAGFCLASAYLSANVSRRSSNAPVLSDHAAWRRNGNRETIEAPDRSKKVQRCDSKIDKPD